MKFTKMHGIGNDYIYVDCTKEPLQNPEEVARAVSDRHFGIGGDGLILINPSDKADFEMAMYNADGSRAEMCGNGIRCVAKYVYDHALTDKTQITIETLAGIKSLDLTVSTDKPSLMGNPAQEAGQGSASAPGCGQGSASVFSRGQVTEVKVDMGAPELVPAKIPVLVDGESAVSLPLEAEGKHYLMTCVSMGNPHCVIFLEEDVRNLDLEKIGPAFENHPLFPARINTEFVNVIDSQNLRMRVWERGAGETLACGTGACAVAVAAILNQKSSPEVTIHLLGGDLQIAWQGGDAPVYMTGTATTVFEGEILL
jgi:diaminopimelate epimerase